MPSHSLGIPKLADSIAEALYARIATRQIDQLDILFTQWEPADRARIIQRRLFPLDMTLFPKPNSSGTPLLNLAPETLLNELVADYIHAQLCTAALHAFAAENEARLEAMTSAHQQIERRFSTLQARQRLVRQEEITAEIIELAAAPSAALPDSQ
ncbi:MAG TPA: F0F1 ATP synthase subunit gamma [Nitrococcus sp.]|nr:F0F1 ATP synthase subunit gamma [Nitrococcus sp.]